MANWAQKLKLQHLQTLIALGEQGNLTHVARMMNITQPALSKWLSQLEDEIGITLFERHSKGLRPSEGGKLLLQHAQRLINDMERSQYEIARFKQGGLVGSLKIGCSPVATDCVSQAILGLLTELPTLHLNIERSDDPAVARSARGFGGCRRRSGRRSGASVAAQLSGAVYRAGLFRRPPRPSLSKISPANFGTICLTGAGLSGRQEPLSG